MLHYFSELDYDHREPSKRFQSREIPGRRVPGMVAAFLQWQPTLPGRCTSPWPSYSCSIAQGFSTSGLRVVDIAVIGSDCGQASAGTEYRVDDELRVHRPRGKGTRVRMPPSKLGPKGMDGTRLACSGGVTHHKSFRLVLLQLWRSFQDVSAARLRASLAPKARRICFKAALQIGEYSAHPSLTRHWG